MVMIRSGAEGKRSVCFAVATLAVALSLAMPLVGQVYTVKPGPEAGGGAAAAAGAPANKTIVSVELLIDETGGGLQVHEWNRVFRDLGLAVRIRRGLAGEAAEVTEQQMGPLRQIRVVGRLDRGGRIIVGNRTFGRQDSARLSEWIRELQTFGAQGNPRGRPLWGLSEAQFSLVYRELSEGTVTIAVAGKPLVEALATLGLPRKHPMRWSVAAYERYKTELAGTATVRQEVEGFSHGTALAMLLNEFDFGFYPLRTPEGAVELSIVLLTDESNVWPVGWEPKGLPVKTAPALYEVVPIELEEAPLLDVLAAVSDRTSIPVRYDYHLIAKYGLKLDEIRVRYPAKKTSWSLILKGITSPARLSHDVRIDEQGQPFLWISTLKIGEFGR